MSLPLKRFRRRHPRVVRITVVFALFVIAFAVGFGYASWALVCRSGRCPSVSTLGAYEPAQTSKVFAADDTFIAELGAQHRTLIKLHDIPPLVRDAFVTVEDKRFYQHHGIDWIRVAGSALHDLRVRSWQQGFSTITMQLARNIFPQRISSEKTLIRKLKEAKVAREIEAHYSKDHILELYLNQIYLGNGAYGVETAAQSYFGKSVRDLNLAEAATLAALPKGPERYNPRRFPARAIQRRNTVIELMRRAGLVSDAQASLAKAYPLRLAHPHTSGQEAPYFVSWIRQQLEDRFGRALYEQGLKIYTTLDPEMQATAERTLDRQLRAIEAGRYGPYPHTTYEQYMAQESGHADREPASSPYLQGAFMAMDPRTGNVLAMVGGRDFDDSKFNRVTQALRQPGSTFKPIVYSDAVENGLAPSYLVPDEPLSVPQADGTMWTPQNFDLKFDGPMTMRRGFYESRNVVAIRVGMQLGEQSVIDMARKFGLTTPIPPYPSIAIGTAAVYPIELISAYSTFANLGVRSAPRGIRRVEDAHGNVLWAPQTEQVSVLSPEEAWLMVDMMKDVITRGTAAGTVGSVFHIPAGGKTGTTDNGTDAWFIGYTPDLVAGVWVGFDQPQKIKTNAQGGLLAAPVWASFMNEVYRRRPVPGDWPRPADIIARTIDGSTDMLATQYCPLDQIYTEYYIPGTEPTQPCNVHTAYGVTPDTLGGTNAPGYPPRDTSGRNPSPDTQPSTRDLFHIPRRPSGSPRRP